MYVCGGGEEKRKEGVGVNGWWGKKKEMGSGVYVYGGKKGREEKERKQKFEKEKTNLGLFVCSLYLVQSIEL